MTRSPLPALRSSYVAGRTVALIAALMMLVIVACTSADQPRETVKFDPTQTPTVTQVTVATTAPDPTATTTPPTGGNTPLAPTATIAVPPPEPTSTPAEPTATTTPPSPTATPKVEPTATPDPLVILVNVITGEVAPNRYPIVAPGDGELLERLFPEAPPYSPHTVSDIQITIDSNKCVTCHGYGLDIGGTIAPQIPESHYTDQLTGEVTEELDPRRYICTSCHVPQVTDPLPFESD